MRHSQLRWWTLALVLAGLSCNLYAVDGVVLIDQNRALAGNVTPGDTPGFPVTISQSGSYRLAGNLTVADANTTAIFISADNVTLDLNGFSIIGPVVCTGTPVTSCGAIANGSGVFAAQSNVTVSNGTVRGFAQDGINVGAASYVEKVHAYSNGGSGIVIGFGVVAGNTVISNGFAGIVVDVNATVSGNYVFGNRVQGILFACPSAIIGNTFDRNGTNLQIPPGTGCVVVNNAAQ